mmetsp:Transcript_32018/g.52909  ORF Transcript_32018/g.52909 Transcript_32018/m.52909 type:complete len:730 (-) Transcript_32018:42-2231(-)
MKVLVLQPLLLAASVCSAAKFGTNNGYDQEGGRAAMCWKVQPESPFAIPSFEQQPAAGVVDDLRSSLINNSSGYLMDECYEGLKMMVKLEENPAGTEKPLLYSGSEATFRFDIKLDPSKVEQGLALVPAKQQVLLRIKFCDASRTGFCRPFKYDSDEKSGDELLGGVVKLVEEGDNEKKSAIKASSPYLLNTLDEDVQNGVSTLNLSVALKFTIPDIWGSYFVIGHGILFFGENSTDKASGTIEIDVANAISPRIYTIKPAPVLLEPTRGYKIGISVLLGVAGMFEAALLVGVIAFRKNMVLKLSQPLFLMLLVLCSLIATVSCVFYIPENDLFCNLWSPLILIPVNVIASILIARGWRMYVILASTLRISLNASKKRVFEERFMSVLTFLASWHELLEEQAIGRFKKRPSTTRRRQSLSSSQHSLRKEVKDHYVLQLIVVLTIPQVIIQIITLTEYPSQLEITDGELFSRVACRSDHWWPILVSVIIVIMLFLMAVFVAYICRDLPSLFNEKAQIFKASWINFIVLLFTGTMIALTDFATTSPNSRAFLWTAITLCVVLTPCFYIVLPKVNRARKGETVVMSRLFASSSTSLTQASNVISPQSTSRPLEQGSPLEGHSGQHVRRVDPLKRADPPKILVFQNDPPPRHLELQFLAMKDLITNVSDSSSEGKQISKHEWKLLQNSALALNNHLQQLEFDWEEGEGGDADTPPLPRESATEEFLMIDMNER